MSTTTSYFRAFDLVSLARGKTEVAPLLAAAKTIWGAMGDALTAAHDYRALTARGMAPDAAAQQVFDRHFAGR